MTMTDTPKTNLTDDEKFAELQKLFDETHDYFLHRYMKVSRNEMDMKIQVLKDRQAGMNPPSITNWDRVQEID